MTTKVEPTVEKWEKILKKAEKYVRANSVYYGNDQYRLSMTDWLYFIKGVANEIEAQSVQEAKAESRGFSKRELMEIKLLVHGRMADEDVVIDGLPDEIQEVYDSIVTKVDKLLPEDEQIKLSTLNTKEDK